MSITDVMTSSPKTPIASASSDAASVSDWTKSRVLLSLIGEEMIMGGNGESRGRGAGAAGEEWRKSIRLSA